MHNGYYIYFIMDNKSNILIIFSSLTSILFVLMLIGYLFFSSELSTMETWRFWFALTGFLVFLSMAIIAVIVLYFRNKNKKIIKGKQVLLWLGYVICVIALTAATISVVMDKQRYWAIAVCVFMIVSATWSVCGILNNMEKKEK